jgi:hypothetical protein
MVLILISIHQSIIFHQLSTWVSSTSSQLDFTPYWTLFVIKLEEKFGWNLELGSVVFVIGFTLLRIGRRHGGVPHVWVCVWLGVSTMKVRYFGFLGSGFFLFLVCFLGPATLRPNDPPPRPWLHHIRLPKENQPKSHEKEDPKSNTHKLKINPENQQRTRLRIKLQNSYPFGHEHPEFTPKIHSKLKQSDHGKTSHPTIKTSIQPKHHLHQESQPKILLNLFRLALTETPKLANP